MNDTIQMTDGSITSPKGFFAAGISCGLKKNGNPDLAVLTSSTLANACGVFTKNVVKGHSLLRTMRVIKNGHAKAVVVNSGNANACVGAQGDRDADSMANELAERIGCSAEEVLTGSTGVIGQLLPMEKILQGIRDAVRQLDCAPEAGHLRSGQL